MLIEPGEHSLGEPVHQRLGIIPSFQGFAQEIQQASGRFPVLLGHFLFDHLIDLLPGLAALFAGQHRGDEVLRGFFCHSALRRFQGACTFHRESAGQPAPR